MTCDKGCNFSASPNTFQAPTSGRTRLFSTPDKQDLETIYENEANSAPATGINPTGIGRSSLKKTSADSTSKRTRIQSVFSSRLNPNDKKANSVLTDPVGKKNNTFGPGGGGGATNSEGTRDSEQTNVHAALTLQPSVATSVATLAVPSGKFQATNLGSIAKEFRVGRVRSTSKADNQSVSDKSVFSRIFSKKSKKPMGTLITTTTNSIDLDVGSKRKYLINKLSLKTNEPSSTIDEQEQVSYDYGEDDDEIDSTRNSVDALSDNNQRTKSATESKSKLRPNPVKSLQSDSEYYASMSSAPTGFSISYHKHMTTGNNDLRLQAALGRLQQQSKKGADADGASQLMSLFQDPQRSGTQSPTLMSGTTRVKTFSGQTIVTRNNSASDRSSTYCIRPSSISPTHDADEIFISDEEIYTHFMKCHTCYDIMPKSSKLVIFDTQLGVKKAFYALVYNGVRAAPLWDNKRRRFIGLLTITDFILILQKYYKEPHAKIEELEEHRIETWREVLREYEKPLLFIRPNQSLFDAIEILLENHVHRLPIIDATTNNVVFILTHKRILRFFYLYIYDWSQPSFMTKSLEELNIGTYDNLHTIEATSTVLEALGYFVKYRISALPVVDEQKKLVNIYSKFDVIGLVPDKSYRNLGMTIDEALSYRKERFEAVAKCYKHESLAICMERIVKAEVHRLVIVDQNEHVIGVLSLSDLLYYIIIRPTKSSHSSPQSPVFTPTNPEIE